MSRTRGGTLLSQVHQVSGRVWNKILRDNHMEDLEGARGRVLFALWGKNGVPIKTLCEKTSLDKSTLTGILSRLERDGYIEKRTDETDKRSTRIFLTGKEEILQFDGMLARILENCKAVEIKK